MKDGRYAKYEGDLYEATYDRKKGGFMLYTNKEQSDNFLRSRLKGYHELYVDKELVDDFFEFKKFEIFQKTDLEVILSTFNPELARRFSFERVGHSEYRRTLESCKCIQVRSTISINNI